MTTDNKKLKRKLIASNKENDTIDNMEPTDVDNNDDEIEDQDLLADIPNDDDSTDEDNDSDYEDSGDDLHVPDESHSEGDDDDSDADGFSGGSGDEYSSDEDSSFDDVDSDEEDEDEEVDDGFQDENTNEESSENNTDLTKNKPNLREHTENNVPSKIELKHTKQQKLSGKQNINKIIIKELKHENKNKLKHANNVGDKESGVLTKDEYADGDTSDEEDIRNTIGNVPINWYDDYKHIGYDWEGKRILKPDHGDQLDYFLRRMEDPNFWRTVRDRQTGQDVVLNDGDVDLIQRLEKQKIPDEAYEEYAPWIEWFTSEVMKMPLRKFPEHKRSFLPSISEKRQVAKLVHALKMGWIKPSKVMQKERRKKLKAGPQFYMLWEGDDVAEGMRRIRNHIPAPKRQLPGHAESYNPPSEYLFNEKELAKFDESKRSLGDKKLHFIPKKYSSLRHVPSYDRYVIERFMRCMDLYLCPRAIKMKLLIEPEDLLPKLPNPRDLQPFPSAQSLVFEGHTDMVRTISMDPLGQYLVSGSDDGYIKFWEISTSRCLKTIKLEGVVRCVRWCPSTTLSLVAVAADNKCFIINPGLGDSLVTSKTDELLEEPPLEDVLSPDRVKTAVQWQWKKDFEGWPDGVLISITHFKEIKQVAWHGRGDYFATVMPDGSNRSVLIHQLSRGRSQLPFTKSKGLIQCVIFHPVRPYFFVATQRNVRIYDLVKQEMIKKLYSSSKWISNIAIHSGGDNILISSYDPKVAWFDLDLSTKPYRVLKLHKTAVRAVAYHKRYPLFASVSDDCNLIICHGMVHNDLMQNALIVPLKKLSYHKCVDDFGIFEVMFHHFQPWVFTCGADKTIRLYS